jgi:hypothetical protein
MQISNSTLRVLYLEARTAAPSYLETGCAGLGVVREKEKCAPGGIRTPAAQAAHCIFLTGSGGYIYESKVK